MYKIPIKNQEQNCVTHHNTLCRFDGSGVLEKRTDHSSSVFAISQYQILRHCLQIGDGTTTIITTTTTKKSIHVLWKLSIFFHTVVYQRNFCDPYSWNNNHAPENPREQQMLSVLFQKLRERKKEKKKGWVHLFFFRFLCFSGNPYKCLYKTYCMHIICFCFSHSPHLSKFSRSLHLSLSIISSCGEEIFSL